MAPAGPMEPLLTAEAALQLALAAGRRGWPPLAMADGGVSPCSAGSSTATVSGSSSLDSLDEERNNTNVYVSDLPPNMSLSRLRAMFGVYGTIIGARLVPRRKGYLPVGFVQFTTAAAARTAIRALNGCEVDGAVIGVRLARRDKDKGIHNKPSATLYVANLPRRFTEADLRALFSQYGGVRSLLIFKHPDTGASKGAALVRFVDVATATAAKEALHCAPIKGQDLPMEVKFAESKHDKEVRIDGNPNRTLKATSPPKDGLVHTPTPADLPEAAGQWAGAQQPELPRPGLLMSGSSFTLQQQLAMYLALQSLATQRATAAPAFGVTNQPMAGASFPTTLLPPISLPTVGTPTPAPPVAPTPAMAPGLGRAPGPWPSAGRPAAAPLPPVVTLSALPDGGRRLGFAAAEFGDDDDDDAESDFLSLQGLLAQAGIC